MNVCSLYSVSVVLNQNTTNSLDHLKRQHMKQLKKAQENDKNDNGEHSTNDKDIDSVISTSTVTVETAGIASKEEESKNKNETFFVVKGISLQNFLKQKENVTSQRVKENVDVLRKLIMQDFQPISIVEDKGFTIFVHLLDERYAFPSRCHIHRFFDTIYVHSVTNFGLYRALSLGK